MREVYESFNPTLVIMDLNLPDSHGLELTREIRAIDADVGIIILTGSEDSVDEIVGLELGADYYVKKPVAERELLARTRSVLRRVKNSKSATASKTQALDMEGGEAEDDFECGNIKFHPAIFNATTLDGKEIELTTHEFRLMHILAKSKNRVLTRDQILNSLYGRTHDPFDRSIDVLIAKIRKKLKKQDIVNTIITVRGAGYKFNTDR